MGHTVCSVARFNNCPQMALQQNTYVIWKEIYSLAQRKELFRATGRVHANIVRLLQQKRTRFVARGGTSYAAAADHVG